MHYIMFNYRFTIIAKIFITATTTGLTFKKIL